MAEKINDIAYEAEKMRGKLQSEEVVSELVHGFLIPEVQKETVRQQTTLQSRRFLVAAHSQVHKEGEEIIDELGEIQGENQDRISISDEISIADSQEECDYGIMDSAVPELVPSKRSEGSPSSMKANDENDEITSEKQDDDYLPSRSVSAAKKGDVSSSRPLSRSSSAVKPSSRPTSAAKGESRPTSDREGKISPSSAIEAETQPTEQETRSQSETKETSRPQSAAKSESRPASATQRIESSPTPKSDRRKSTQQIEDGRVFGAATPPGQTEIEEGSEIKTPPKPISRPSSAVINKEETKQDNIQRNEENSPEN